MWLLNDDKINNYNNNISININNKLIIYNLSYNKTAKSYK